MPNAVDFLNEPDTAPNAIDFLNEKPDAVAFLNEPDDTAKDANPNAHSFTPSQSDIDIVARASREGKPVIMVNGKPTVGDVVKNEPLSTGDRLVQGAESSLGTTALRAGAGALRLAGESGIADELSADANAWKHKQGTDTASKIGSGIGGAAGLIASGGLPGALTNIGLQSQAEKLSFGAALKAVPELAAYWLLGMGAGKAIGPLVAQASPAVKALASGAAATTANIAASAAIRKVNGESAVPDSESLAQDALFGFGAHGMAEGRKAVLDEAAVKSMLKHAPDDALNMASEDPDFRKSAPYDPKLLDEEISRRKEQGQENSHTGDQVAQPVPTEVKDQVANNLRESNAPLTAEQVSNEIKSNTNRDEQSQQGDSTTGSGLQPRTEDNAAGVRPSAPGAEGIGAADGETPTAQPAAPREADQPVVGEPGYTGGPGAMSPVEAAEMAARQKTTSIKNEVVDQARVDAEIPEREKPLRRAFGQVWDEAKAVIDTNPNKGRELVDELQKKSRPLTDTEDAILSHEQLERQDAYNNAVERVNNATGEAEMAEAKSALESARSDLHEIYDAGQKSGTANARGLAARRMMIRDDYSLARMETRMRAEQGGTPLSQSQLDQVKVAHERITELEKKLADAETKQRDDLAKQYFDKLLDETKKDLKKSVKTGEKITDFFSRQAEAARERIRGRGSRLNAGLDPVDLFDHAIIGADYLARGVTKFAEWSAEMVKDFGEKVSPYLEQIFETSQKYHDTNSTLAEKLQPKDETPQGIAKTITKENGLNHQTVYELARAHVRAGVEGFENVMQAVTKDLKEKLPDVTERQVRDAFSEYGKTKFPSKEADRMKLAEYRRLGQLASAIEDAQKKISPQKTGLQRDKPTQAVREKMAELRKAMDEAGIETKSPEEQLASRNQARATALRNQIEDLDKQLKTGEKPARGKPVADSTEVETLRSQRDAMKAELQRIESEAKPKQTPEQLASEKAQQALDRAAAALDRQQRINSGEIKLEPNEKRVPLSDLEKELRDKTEELRKAKREADKAIHGKSPEEIKLQAYKNRIKNRLTELKEKLDKGDYTKPVRSKLELDAEASKLRADYERQKQKFDSEIERIRANNRTRSQKFWDRFVGVQRAFKLSSDVVLAKLSTAAAVREGILTPAEEVVGGVVSKLLPRLADRAPREGGLSLKAEVKAKVSVFTKGMKDAWQNLQMKKSDLETTYGSKKPAAPPEWYEYFGFLHGALKAPVKRAEFARSLEKRTLNAVKNGLNIDNPEVMRGLANEAYVDANRAIFMQDNVFATAWNNAIAAAERSKSSPNLGPAMARLGRFLVPIVKVPSNIVGETATGVHGTITGSIRAAKAYIDGVEKLPPDQADAIMRQLKKGLVGNAILLAGYLSYKSIGGFYEKNDKRKETDVQPGHLRIGNVDLPPYVSHSTLGILLNVGATVHRVEEEKVKGKPKGIVQGALTAASGVAKELPAIPAVSGIADALESQEGMERYIHQMITSTAVPAIVQHAAKLNDTPGSFPSNTFVPANKRNPETNLDALKMGIPVLREQVPMRKKKH